MLSSGTAGAGTAFDTLLEKLMNGDGGGVWHSWR
jgi:hypothetical protein